MKTESDLWRMKGNMMDLVENTELKWWQCVKQDGNILGGSPVSFCAHPDTYTSAIELVEGRPAFDNAELYDKAGIKFTAEGYSPSSGYLARKGGGYIVRAIDASWNPPAPAIPHDFTPHNGGECPVSGDTIVHRFYSDGSGVGLAAMEAKHITWGKVVGYKIHKPDVVKYFAINSTGGCQQISKYATVLSNLIVTANGDTGVLTSAVVIPKTS